MTIASIPANSKQLGCLMPKKVTITDGMATVEWEHGESTTHPIEMMEEICQSRKDDPAWQKVQRLINAKKDKKPDLATQLVQMAYQDDKAEYFCDTKGQPYARLFRGDHYEIISLDEKDSTFDEWLSFQYYCIEGKVPGSESLRSAINILKGKARYTGNTKELSIRVASFDNAFWYYLSDEKRRAVRIDKEGWAIVPEPPALFRHINHMKPQDTPIAGEGGAIDEFLKWVNVQGDDLEIFKIMLVTDLIPGIAHYGLSVSGLAGSAKSMMLQLEKMLVDPSEIDLTSFPKEEKDLHQLLDHHHIIAFDNVEGINTERSNILCRAITGTAIGQRGLYTNDQDFIRKYKRIIRMNGLNNEIMASDLLDRIILMDLQPLPTKRSEKEVWSKFYELRPRVLGEILTILSKTIRVRSEIEIPESKARLADWYEWAEAAAKAMGMEQKKFADLFAKYIEKQNAEALEQSQLAPMLMKVVDDHGQHLYVGTASDLLTALNEMAEYMHKNITRTGWPTDATRLSKKITPLIPNLKSRGYHVKRCKYEELQKNCPMLIQNFNSDRSSDRQLIGNPKSRIMVIYFKKDTEKLPHGWDAIGNTNLENYAAENASVPDSQQVKD